MKTEVGHSDSRTPAKHQLLNGVMGNEVGSAPKAAKMLRAAHLLPRSLTGHSMFDLTAGDGVIRHETTSPLLFAKHALFRDGTRRRFDVTLVERADNHYAALLDNLAEQLPQIVMARSGQTYHRVADAEWHSSDGLTTLRALLMNSRDLTFSDVPLGHWIFISNDPNTVHDWALNARALEGVIAAGARVRIMSTMGCNPGGLKRLSIAERETWYIHVEDFNNLARRLKTIDNILISIENDPSQWAYLITIPNAWVGGEIENIERLFHRVGLRVRIESLRQGQRGFMQELDYLFLTNKERAA